MSRLKRVSRTATVAWAAIAGVILLMVAARQSAGSGAALAQSADGKPAATDHKSDATRWFEDARFGLFIDWGVNSLLGKGESVMNDDKLPIPEYAKLPARFYPTRFDAEALVKLAKGAGVKYITITAKQSDGFCMFATRLTDYDIVDSTPYRLDPIRALADACRQQKIKLFFSYSLLDWHHPDYFPLGKTGQTAGREATGDWKRYVSYYQGQVRELCSNYGEVGGIWFDGMEDRPDAEWDLAGTYRLVHELQPGARVGNNHHQRPLAGEDIQRSGPIADTAASTDSRHPSHTATLPRETWLTINDSQGYNPRDTNLKSAESIIHALVAAAGRGANLRLSVGPGPDGTLGSEITQRLLDVGKWLEAHGDTVFGTRRGPIPPQPWGVSTARSTSDHFDKIYIHILEPHHQAPILFDGTIPWIPIIHGKTTPLKMSPTGRGLRLDVPKHELVPIDTIIVLTRK